MPQERFCGGTPVTLNSLVSVFILGICGTDVRESAKMGTCGADALIENLTVYEMLIYTAELKIPNTQSFQQKKDKVDAVINQLALNTCRNVRIGSTISRGISGMRGFNNYELCKLNTTKLTKLFLRC